MQLHKILCINNAIIFNLPLTLQSHCIIIGLTVRKGDEKMKQWNLIRLRDEAGMTQKDMGKILGISGYSYMRKENGQTRFYDYEMFMLSEYFNKTIDQIFLNPNCNDIAIS